MKLRTWKVL